MSFEATFLPPGSLQILTPKSLPSLLSAARSEFYRSNGYSGKFMQEVTVVLSHIGKHVYGTGFLWSAYNKKEWKKFVASRSSSPEGGACMFSCEADGDYSPQQDPNALKGVGIGVPTGMFPYSVWVCRKSNCPALRSAVASLGKYSMDLVSDGS